jgi:hypothetical protein
MPATGPRMDFFFINPAFHYPDVLAAKFSASLIFEI